MKPVCYFLTSSSGVKEGFYTPQVAYPQEGDPYVNLIRISKRRVSIRLRWLPDIFSSFDSLLKIFGMVNDPGKVPSIRLSALTPCKEFTPTEAELVFFNSDTIDIFFELIHNRALQEMKRNGPTTLLLREGDEEA